MIEYLRSVFGITASESPWKEADTLPRYLRSNCHYSILSFDGVNLLLMYIKQADFNVQSYEKQLVKIHDYWPGEIAIVFDQLSFYQRKTLIEQRIQFIVPGYQLYLPRLGVVLQEFSRKPSALPVVTTLSPVAQLVVLHMLYHPEHYPVSKVALSRQLHVNAMAVVRAIQELKALKLVICQQEGRSIYITPALWERELWDKCAPYMCTPVRKVIFARKNDQTDQLTISGEEALSKLSMLGNPRVPVRAISRKDFNSNSFELVDPAWQQTTDYVMLEIWNYDPSLFKRDGIVDPLSLYLSFKDNPDERIEEAIENILEAYQW